MAGPAQAAVPAPSRPPLAMALPRPSMNKPAPTAPAASAPEVGVAAIGAPPIAPLDMRGIEPEAPKLPQPAQPVVVSDYKGPELLSRVEPVYSAFARNSRLQGSVKISATIGADGVPRNLSVVGGNATLAEMGLEAVRQWRYKPATLNGQPVESQTNISFNFQLR